ncbi:signal recognition particle-docking protein FtsY [Halobellus ruber]|uniref:Signal recognition particle receptor FtsY n=1 Tax=Halobellus ruber TaxID=2761102 RepID=A0A7J9SKI9_9EURY|nr:signal recognition particle-docking protein FtsY [Halobellus ruber]MBB6647445.1 signal recognition particle-docking protein FtsY [Halobellus ruber]
MFDGLKDKLGSFREDVEETAEEKAEAEAAAEADAADDEEAEPTADGDGGVAVDATADPDAEPDVDSDPGDADGEPADDRTEIAADEAAAALKEDDEEKSGPGRLKRAAAFATGKIIIEEEDLEDPLWNLEMALLESDVEMNVAEEILDTIRGKMIGETRAQVETTGELVESALRDALYDVISVGQFDFDQRIEEADKPVTIVFTGVNGVGKTTSIAKLSRYFEKRGLDVVLANGDTYRAGANEQIREHADALGTKLISHEQGGDPAAVLYDAVEYAEANDVDVVLGDTAGRLHTSNDLMAQLEKIDRVVDPDMTLFVDEAVAGQDAVERAKQFNDAAEIDGTVLTKADADSSGGAAISIAYVTGRPILFLGVGQGYDDIERFDPERLVDRLVGGA